MIRRARGRDVPWPPVVWRYRFFAAFFAVFRAPFFFEERAAAAFLALPFDADFADFADLADLADFAEAAFRAGLAFFAVRLTTARLAAFTVRVAALTAFVAVAFAAVTADVAALVAVAAALCAVSLTA